MIVCVCNRVNSAQIREAVRNGVTDVEGMTERLGLGSCCGTCVEFAQEMIAAETKALAYEVTTV